jgi:hypothetical protein
MAAKKSSAERALLPLRDPTPFTDSFDRFQSLLGVEELLVALNILNYDGGHAIDCEHQGLLGFVALFDQASGITPECTEALGVIGQFHNNASSLNLMPIWLPVTKRAAANMGTPARCMVAGGPSTIIDQAES